MSMRMARLAQRANPRSYGQAPEGESIPIPAPYLGMNTRDGVMALQPGEARSIRNMIAENGKIVGRKGKTEHQEIEGAGSVGTIWTHEGVTTNVILAAADGEIYDATGTPSVLTSSANYSLDTWSIEQFNDTSIGVNGTDTPWAFDGSAIGATGLSGSGLTIANLRTIKLVGVRLWLTEEGSADVWYGAPNAVTGALTKFQLSQETKGGYCVGVFPYKSYTIFVMSTGEITAYQGDPGSDFSQVSTYSAPRPVGYDCGVDVQGDLVLMTTSGPLPFEGIAAGVAFDTSALGAWGKIAPSWAMDFESYGSLSGWIAKFYKGLVIFNIPTDTTASKQWVFNTRTKGWSFFDSLNATNFTENGGVLYFGGKDAGFVYSNTGGTDDGEPIVASVRHGFTYPFANKVNGQFTLARINAQATGTVTGQIQVDTDYKEQGVTAPDFPLATAGDGPWDEAWDEAWGEDGEPLLRWSSVKGFGRAVAPVVQFNSQADDLQYFATDVVVAPAGVIG